MGHKYQNKIVIVPPDKKLASVHWLTDSGREVSPKKKKPVNFG